MKILYVMTGLGLGGAEKVVCDLADQMVKNGHTVKIAYLTGGKLVTPKSSDIEIIYLALNGINSFISASVKYRKLLKKFQPDVVHAHMVHANIFTRLNRIVINVPRLICSAHSNNEGGRNRMLAYRLTHHLADYTTNVSNNACETFQQLKAVPKNDIHVVYNGVDINKFKYHANKNLQLNNEKIFVAVGRFHDAKDYPNLIQAFSLLLKNWNKFHVKLKIIGQIDDVIYPDVNKLIYIKGLSDSVEIMGKRDDISILLSQADFFVLSSKYEGLPTVVIEAMSSGTFVIGTDCGGTAEIMGDTGILVKSQNSQALAKAMQQALSLSNEQVEVNNLQARKRIEELFSLEKSVKKWLKIYRNE